MWKRFNSPRVFGRVVVRLLCFLVPISAHGATPDVEEPAFSRRVNLGGLELDVGIASLESELLTAGRLARFRFSLRDEATGKALSGIFPAAWMDFGTDALDDDSSCARRIEMLVGGGLLSRAELDLNVYYVVAMNDDATLTVVDPLFGFGGSRLLAMVRLRGPGRDWALTADQRRLLVTVPDADAVAVVDTGSWSVETYVTTGGEPGRVIPQPGSENLWVGFHEPDGRSGVSVVRPDRYAETARLHTGKGPVDLAVDHEGRYIFVAHAGEDTVAIVDAHRLEVVKTLQTGAGPTSLTWSRAARALYVAHRDSGIVAVVDGDALEVAAEIPTAPGLGQIRASPEGFHVLAVHPREGLLFVIDPARRRLVQTGPLAAEPDQIAFSDTLAYIRHLGSDQILMIPLAEIGSPGRPIPAIDFPGGHGLPGKAGAPSPASAIVRAPGASAVLVANPKDEAIYFYAEGMAAPMGSFDNFDRIPRAVLVVDNSLRQTSPGTYETVARLRRPGRYQLAFFLDAPRVTRCFPVDVHADPEHDPKEGAPRFRARSTAENGRLEGRAGHETTAVVELIDARAGDPSRAPDELEMLVFSTPGTWQHRGSAVRGEDGRFYFRFTPPREGIYYLYASSGAARLPLGESGPVAYISVAPSEVPSEVPPDVPSGSEVP